LLATYGAVYILFISQVLTSDVALYITLNGMLVGRGYAFVLGAVAAWIVLRHEDALKKALPSFRFFRYGGGDAIALVLLLALGYVLSILARVDVFTSEFTLHYVHVIETALWTAIVLAVVLFPIRMKSVLSNRFFQHTGRISYSLYLCHLPILVYCFPPASRLLQKVGLLPASPVGNYLIFLLVCFGICTLTYRLIERPFLAMKKRYV
jgi:peptidoglycan/LPS O-acetylase OafA/YrhL